MIYLDHSPTEFTIYSRLRKAVL